MSQAKTPGLEHEADSSYRAVKLLMSKIYPGTAQQFRAQMQRVYDRCKAQWEQHYELVKSQAVGRWESSGGDNLYFTEYRHRPRRHFPWPNLLYETGIPFSREEDNRPDITPLTRTSWAICKMNLGFRTIDITDIAGPTPQRFHTNCYIGLDNRVYKVYEWIEGQLGYAGIEAYEQHNGTLVEFKDGYFPEVYIEGGLPSTGSPIGPAFDEFCEFVISQVWGDVTTIGDLTPLERKIVEVVAKLEASGVKATDELVAARVPYNPRTGKSYTRNWINNRRNKLRDKGYDV